MILAVADVNSAVGADAHAVGACQPAGGWFSIRAVSLLAVADNGDDVAVAPIMRTVWLSVSAM